MRTVAALVGCLFLSGCSGAGFESRFEDGLSPAYMQGSPAWRDAGLFDALPAKGEHNGFTVGTGEGPAAVVFPPGTATEFHFQDSGLDDVWGTYRLSLVRWREMDGTDPQTNLAFHIDPESLQGWVGAKVTEEETRSWFRFFAGDVLPATDAELDALESDFMASRRTFGLNPDAGHGTAAAVDGYHHVVSYAGPVRLEELFTHLGGLPGFTATPRHQALLLPSPGQVDLVAGHWEFAFQTALRTAQRGGFADRDAFLVTPDDSVMYVHWGKDDLDDRQLAAKLASAFEDLGRSPPDASGWTFTRERIEGGPD